jgi:hypothetical protein
MFVTHATLGSCAACRDQVILVTHRFEGFRYCLGCQATGPDVTLVSELKSVEDFFDADDFTEVTTTPWALLDETRRS